MLSESDVKKRMKKAMNDRYQGKYPKALDNFDAIIKELAASDEEWARLATGEAMHQLGVTLQNMGKDYKAALSCLWTAIAYRQVIGDSIGLAYTYFQVPMCRLASGEKVEDVMPDFMIAEKAIVVAISLAARKDNYKVLGDMWHNAAYICQLQESYQDALAAYDKALSDRVMANDKRGAGLTYARMSECWEKLGEIENAKSDAKKALEIFQEIGDVNRIKQVEKTLQEIEQEEKGRIGTRHNRKD